ncbi:MAG: stage II sporulation protein D [Oscillospiraceae bacterium]|nr:stage II sporulation protein D [Oscillospiraceae bacterium]
MKRFLTVCFLLWIFVFTIPLLALRNHGDTIPELPLPTVQGSNGTTDASVTVTLNNNGTVENLPLDEYLRGVVAAEMPALFPEEALKAQAVAARTYTMKKLTSPPSAEHSGAAVCSDPAHCKAYSPLSSFAAAWNDNSEKYTEKISRAVKETDGEILLYDNEPISAVFHSTSSGMTENAKDIWGGDAPYLKSVKSTGDEDSPHFKEEVKLPPEEFKEKFLEKHKDAVFDKNPENWITNISRTDAGSIMTLSVGGVNIKGSELRSLFGLKSANFKFAYTDGSLVFTTLGYGHGVGMSQYGARAMALEGKKYDEILSFYYTDVTLGKISRKTS